MNQELTTPAFERHYSVGEVAEIWGFKVDIVRSIFKDEPGVIRLERPETRYKRGYCTLRIPESVVHKVHDKLTRKRAA